MYLPSMTWAVFSALFLCSTSNSIQPRTLIQRPKSLSRNARGGCFCLPDLNTSSQKCPFHMFLSVSVLPAVFRYMRGDFGLSEGVLRAVAVESRQGPRSI